MKEREIIRPSLYLKDVESGSISDCDCSESEDMDIEEFDGLSTTRASLPTITADFKMKVEQHSKNFFPARFVPAPSDLPIDEDIGTPAVPLASITKESVMFGNRPKFSPRFGQ